MLGVMVIPAAALRAAVLRHPRVAALPARGRPKGRAREVLAEVEGKDVDLDARVAEIEHGDAARAQVDLQGPARRRASASCRSSGSASASRSSSSSSASTSPSTTPSTLWQSVGIDPTSSFLYSFTTSIVNIIGTVIAMVFVDRIGRKPLALIGSVGMAISLGPGGLGLLLQPARRHSCPTTQGTVALIAAHCFVLFFALSWGVVVWVFLGEMFPNKIRAAALGVAASAQWIANWAITASFPTLADWNLSGTYVIYTFFAVLSIPFVSSS